ncbi:MAG: cytochrome c maturation protein CcmE [Candidatus Bathyarchaeota archaeon]|jgi:cytochrome c-type biogenesis protein CcmE
MKIQGKHIVVGVLLLTSAGLFFDSLSNYMNPYLSVTQVALNLERYSGKPIQVMGIVEGGSFIRGDGGTIQFTLTDGQESLPVQFTGSTPQNFDEGKDIVAVGSLSEEASLDAAKILVKCPSKYEGENPPKQNIHIFLTAVALAVLTVAYLAFTTLWKRG